MISTVDLLSGIQITQVVGEMPNKIKGIYNDSREVQAGGLFFCIVGYQVDGHQFLQSAYKNGAILAIVEKKTSVDIAQVVVKNSRIAMARIAANFYGHASRQLFVVGITATNGKTSTSFMVDEIFKQAGRQRAIIGTVKTEFKGFLDPSILTTPESLTLQYYFKQMLEVGVSHVTMEVSSSGLELKRTCDVDFDVVALNNISHEHVDQHGSFEKYVACKSRLIKEAKSSTWAILNLDDNISKSLIHQTKAKVFTYGCADESGDLVVKDLDLSTGKAVMKVALTREITTQYGMVLPTTFNINLNVAGFNSVMNSLVALAVSIVSGVSKSDIEQGLANYKGVERRFEIVYDREFKIIDDHFANIGNIDVTLKTLSLMEFKKIVFVYAIRGSRGVMTNRENAERIAHWAPKLGIDFVIATLSKSHVTTKDIVTIAECVAFKEEMTKAGLDYVILDELSSATAMALDRVAQGDVLLLAGCQGMDYGAHVILKQMAMRNPQMANNTLFDSLIGRVCGVEEE